MPPISTNDQVLNTIALEFGIAAQMPGIILPDVLRPVLDVQPFRRRFRQMSVNGVPSGAAGNIVITATPLKEAWRIVAASYNNGQPGAGLEVFLTTDRGIPFIANYNMEWGRMIVPMASRQAIIGPMAVNAASDEDEQRPAEIFVPEGGEFRLTGTKEGGGLIEVGGQQLDMLIEVLPAQRVWDLVQPKQALFP